MAGAILTAAAYAITLTGAYRYKVFEDSADAFILALLASAALAVNIALYCGIALSPGWGILGKKTVINDYDVHIANIVYLVLIASAILSHRFLLKVKGCAMYRMTCLVFILINMVLIVISVVNIHGFTMFSGLTTLVVFMVVCFPVMWIATGKFKFWEGTGQRIKDSATDDAQGEAENFIRDLIE